MDKHKTLSFAGDACAAAEEIIKSQDSFNVQLIANNKLLFTGQCTEMFLNSCFLFKHYILGILINYVKIPKFSRSRMYCILFSVFRPIYSV